MQDISTANPGTLIPARRSELRGLFGSGRVGGIPDGHGRGTVLLGAGGVTSRVAAGLSYAAGLAREDGERSPGTAEEHPDPTQHPRDRGRRLQAGQLVRR